MVATMATMAMVATVTTVAMSTVAERQSTAITYY